MRYLATINTPGYLPWDDDPPVFDTAAEAWEYLADERERAEDDTPDEWLDPDRTTKQLRDIADGEGWVWVYGDGQGTVYGSTPGYDGDHDLGLAYSVTAINEED